METRPKNAAEIAWDRDQLIERFDEAIDPLTSLGDEWRDMDGDCYLSTMMRCLRVISRIECANRVCQKDQVGDQYDENTCSPGRYEHMPAKYTTEARSVLVDGESFPGEACARMCEREQSLHDAVAEAMVRDDRN